MDTQTDNIEIFNNNLSTFKAVSKDKNNGMINYMTQSEIRVINFDNVKDEYFRDMKLFSTPCSSDALFISASHQYYFVEFKNGYVGKATVYQVYNKIYDSL